MAAGLLRALSFSQVDRITYIWIRQQVRGFQVIQIDVPMTTFWQVQMY